MNVNKNIEIMMQEQLFSEEVYSHFEEISKFNEEHENFEKKIVYIGEQNIIYLFENKESNITTINTKFFSSGKEKRTWIKEKLQDAYILNLINRIETSGKTY